MAEVNTTPVVSDPLVYTPVEDIQAAYDTVQATFQSGVTRDIEWRKRQIKQLGFMIQDNEDAFVAALKADLNRPAFETIVSETNALKAEINEAFNHVKNWSAPKSISTTWLWTGASPKVYSVPKGVALVIGTWNFPIVLLLGPLLGAISAGCACIVKPAEQSAHIATLIAKLMPLYLDSSAYQCISGAVDQTTALLKLKFDHIFYTGSGNIGRIIARAAAEHLTPVTLELGGKSPAVILDDADMTTAARRVLWSKITNSGQICIAADYVICSSTAKPKFIAALKAAHDEFVPSGKSLLDEEEYTKIVSSSHFERLSKLLEKTKGDIVLGGKASPDTNKIEVTVVDNVKEDDILLASEIFGPILPILTLDTKEEICKYISARENPLALYVFTTSTADSKFIFEYTRSGGFVQNDVLVQFLIPGLPFGGHGPSGTGNYHGKASFDTFSHARAHVAVPIMFEPVLANRYPPYTSKKMWMMMAAAGATIKGRIGSKPNL